MKASRGIVCCYLTAASSLAAVDLAHAVQPLQGRDINGKAVDAYAANAVFEYDPNLDVTWLRDWNFAFTSGYAAAHAGGVGPLSVLSNGAMGWDAARAWASSLTVGAFGGWALPATNPDDTSCSITYPLPGGFTQHSGYYCTGSQMGYLWYKEFNYPAGYSVAVGPFENLQSDYYWSGTEYAPNLGAAWTFTNFGYQDDLLKSQAVHAVALRPGDVATVPEPGAWTMMLAGLSAVAVGRIRSAR